MMSIFDIIQSLAMLVGAAAIPRETNIYGAKGNVLTCDTQGFFMMIGYSVPLYNSCLNIFYVLTIQYGITAQRFAKFEPALHAISILIPLSVAIFYTAGGYMAPRGPVCFPRGVLPLYTICAILTLCFLICIVSMGCICLKVILRAAKMKKYTNFGKKNKSPAQRRSSQSRVSEDKIQTIIQALLYMSAFMLTYSAPYISSFYTRGRVDTSLPFAIETLIKILYPLQGFWNFVFYIRPGVKKVMQSNPDKSHLGAILDVIFKPENIINAHRESRALRRAKIPKITSQKRRKIVAESETMSPLFHMNDQDSEEISSVRGLNDTMKNCDKSKTATHDLALTELQVCHWQEVINRSGHSCTAIAESEEGLEEIIDEEDSFRISTDMVREISNESGRNEARQYHESIIFGPSILRTYLHEKIDNTHACIPTNCRIKTDDVSIFEENLENQSQMQPKLKVQRRVSLVDIGSILFEMDIASLDSYSSSDES